MRNMGVNIRAFCLSLEKGLSLNKIVSPQLSEYLLSGEGFAGVETMLHL